MTKPKKVLSKIGNVTNQGGNVHVTLPQYQKNNHKQIKLQKMTETKRSKSNKIKRIKEQSLNPQKK